MQLDLSKSLIRESEIFTKNYKEKLELIRKKLHSDNHSAGTTWVDWPVNYDKKEFNKMITLSKKVKKNSQVLLVVGIGGSYLGAKSGIDLLKKDKGIEVVFVGINFDYIDLYEKLNYVKDKDITVNVVSKSGTTVEILCAYSIIEKFMKKKYKSDYKSRIIFTTDKQKGYLRSLAKTEKIDCLTVPDDMGGRYSVLSSVGLFPFACAGINVEKIMKGAQNAYFDFLQKENIAEKYAVYRHLVNTKLNKKIEIFSSFYCKLASFGQWLTQLFNESEGKDGKGLYVTNLTFSTDLHSVGQFIQQGSPILAETFIDVKIPQKNSVLTNLSKTSPIKFLEGKSYDDVNRAGFNGTIKAHNEAGVPISVITIDIIDELNYGYLVYFFEMSCVISAYLLDVNPFNQPGVEQYKSYMKELLNTKK